jgi:Domain of unknown function DUF29
MNELYETDFALWAKGQAELLRLRAEGRLVNEAELDWSNIAEEIESVGNEQRFAVESLLTNIMRHQLQIAAWPEAQARQHWQHEMADGGVQVRRRLQRNPGLRPVIETELPELYRDAVETMYGEVDGVPRPPVSRECPFTLDGLLAPSS